MERRAPSSSGSIFSGWAAALSMLLPGLSVAHGSEGVQALFNLSSPVTAPFPSDYFTVFDPHNLTYRRVDLPTPDCAARPSDCEDYAIVNTLDGFNIQTRLRIPFSGAIDPSSVSSANVYLVSLGDTTHPFKGYGKVVGINQIVWHPESNVLSAEVDEQLDQHTTYVLVVTNGVLDANGRPVRRAHTDLFPRSVHNHIDWRALQYRGSVLGALLAARVPLHKVVAASVFTTRSVTATLETIRAQIKASTPAGANFLLAPNGARTVFPLTPSLSVTGSRQSSTTAFSFSGHPYGPQMNSPNFIPGAVSAIAYGTYVSPNYLTPKHYLPPVATRDGVPQVQSQDTLYFNLVIPSGPKPAEGWPVAIFGHGLPGDKDSPISSVASSMAARGFAVLTINAVANGGGPLSTLRITAAGMTPIVIPAGGRTTDPNNTGTFDPIRESSALAPYSLVSYTDSMRQTVIDLMQLIRVIEVGGMDYDGDAVSDLNASRIYYFGHSWGAMYGSILLGVEPNIRAGVLNSGGGGVGIVSGLSPISRQFAGFALANRTPSLLNAPPLAAPTWGFDANTPLRNQPTVINTVPGAEAIQEYSELGEWAQQGGATVAYARYIRKDPLAGATAKPVIVQFGMGDLNVPNPTQTGVVRAGDLSDVTTYYRTDLAVALTPTVPKNPHGVMTSAFLGAQPIVRTYGRALQNQIAEFFVSDGATILDPDGSGTIFETPIVPPLPEELNFIP